jgi:hypothetical protein
MAFGGLVVATVAAFFIIQHIKVGTPLIAGTLTPSATAINPRDGGSCTVEGKLMAVNARHTSVSFFLVHRADNVSVYVVNQRGRTVATLASNVFMPAELFPHQVPRTFTWNGRGDGGAIAPAGLYYIRVVLRRQGRTIDITNPNGLVDWITVCPGM